jgi:hypothetical protein
MTINIEMDHFKFSSIIRFLIIWIKCEKYVFIIYFLNHSLMDENIIIFVIGDVDKWNSQQVVNKG